MKKINILNRHLILKNSIVEKFTLREIFSVLILLVFTIPYSNQGITKPVIVAFGIIFIVIYFLLLPKIKNVINLISENKFLFGFIMYAAFSWWWSDHSEAATLRLFKFLVVSMFAVYLMVNFNYRSIFKLIVTCLSVLAILNILAVVIAPSFAIHDKFSSHAELWRGISSHKNTLGTLSLLCYISHSINVFTKGVQRTSFFFILLSALLIYKSGSTTTLVMTLIFTGILLVVFIFRRIKYFSFRAFSTMFLLSFLLVGLIFVTQNFTMLANAMGKDPNLTGRTGLWDSAENAAQDHLWFGYGYGSFFSDSDRVLQYFHWGVTSSHSGFRDLQLDLGLMGLLIVSLLIVSALYKLFKKKTKFAYSSWILILCILIFTVINNITDSRFLNSLTLYWLLFSLVVMITNRRSVNEPPS